MKDYYTILGLSPTCSQEEIRRQYRKLAMQFHPDRNTGSPESEERFKQIAEAYGVLGDSDKRREFDLSRRKTTPSSSKKAPPKHKDFQSSRPPKRSPHSFTQAASPDQQSRGVAQGSQLLRPFVKLLKNFSGQPQTLRKVLLQAQKQLFPQKEKLQRWFSSAASTLSSFAQIPKKIPRKKSFSPKTRFFRQRRGQRQDSSRTSWQNQHDQQRELDLVYQTPLTRSELKKGKAISVRVFNNSTTPGYEFFKVTIPPGSQNGQKLRIRGKGHVSGCGQKRGDLYLHLVEKS